MVDEPHDDVDVAGRARHQQLRAHPVALVDVEPVDYGLGQYREVAVVRRRVEGGAPRDLLQQRRGGEPLRAVAAPPCRPLGVVRAVLPPEHVRRLAASPLAALRKRPPGRQLGERWEAAALEVPERGEGG